MKHSFEFQPAQEELPSDEEKEVPAEDQRRNRRAHSIELAELLIAHHETLPFPGMNPDAYQRQQEDEERLPGIVNPIAERLKRFEEKGMKVIIDGPPDDNGVFVVPALTEPKDYYKERLFPRQLLATPDINPILGSLIENNMPPERATLEHEDTANDL